MPRPRNQIPNYRLHKQSGQAVVTVNLNGTRKDILLGKYGTPESKAEYERILAELRAAGPTAFAISTGAGPADLTVNELLLAFWKHAEQHYRHSDGTPTNETNNYKAALRPLRQLYGDSSARTFSPLGLKAVRQKMIEAELCRTEINARIGRIKRVFKWAVSEELIPASVHQSLATVVGLQKGRAAVRESEPIGPVDPARWPRRSPT